MAAGLTVAAGGLEALGEWLEERLAGPVSRATAERALLLDLTIAPRGMTPELAETLESAGPFGMGWAAPVVAVGPVHLVKAEIVGNGHLRLIVAGADGGSFKAMAFRAAEDELGQQLLHRAAGRKLWLAGKVQIDDWGAQPKAELHLTDAAWAD